MSKLHCAICGVQLVIFRKAIPGKGAILELVEPHECQGQAVPECPEGGETVLQIINNLKPLSAAVKVDDNLLGSKDAKPSLFDQRGKESLKTSSAPSGLLNHLSPSNVDDVGEVG